MARALAAPDLDLLCLDYWRTVAALAGRINTGADLREVCIASGFVGDSALARHVPTFSATAPLISAQALADAPVLRVHQLLARHCLLFDVLRCLARYHDEELARFWAEQLAVA